ncbi:hypothetical protein [Candidatus Hydrogenosomobacter endosymbioticus]|uniref:Uncharacterized protein n=1 Tax=Candidatus Hydrogenosomobacter endosymbioticus TaxID=2558174 RepID=A0ABM7V833_9PROT|nr:hypothetical protein [Candidatus Hydrogenosomobacter endosymbioticus]BDB95920.1 hypothetical protein HYD_0530 [Candidatus Hydrogenosomobacter endosymbioticus]
MTIVYRSEKKAPLTADEVDGNFRDLDERLSKLEKSVQVGIPESIASVKVDQGKLHIFGTKGTKLSEVDVPVLSWRPRGMWQQKESYNSMDVVYYQDSLHLCLAYHVSDNFNPKFWQEILNVQGILKSCGMKMRFYSNESLPKNPELGTLCVTNIDNGIIMAYYDGKTWQRVSVEQGK